MPYTISPDVETLVAHQMSTGRYQTEDDVLRSALEALTQQDEDIVAVQAAVDEWRQGDSGLPLDEVMRRIRESATSGANE